MIRKPLNAKKAASIPDIIRYLVYCEVRELAPAFGYTEQEVLSKISVLADGSIEFADDIDHEFSGNLDKFLRSHDI